MRTNCANMQLHSSHLKVVPILAAKAAATEAASQTTQPTKVRSKQKCDIGIFLLFFFMQREVLAGKNVLFCCKKRLVAKNKVGPRVRDPCPLIMGG